MANTQSIPDNRIAGVLHGAIATSQHRVVYGIVWHGIPYNTTSCIITFEFLFQLDVLFVLQMCPFGVEDKNTIIVESPLVEEGNIITVVSPFGTRRHAVAVPRASSLMTPLWGRCPS